MNDQTTPTQARIVAAVAEHGLATAQRIAEATGLGYSTVTAQLRKLATAGLIERQHDSTWTAITPQRPPREPDASPQPADARGSDPAGELAVPEPADALHATDTGGTEAAIEPEPPTGHRDALGHTDDDNREALASRDGLPPDLDPDTCAAVFGDNNRPQPDDRATADNEAGLVDVGSRPQAPDEQPDLPADEAVEPQTTEAPSAAGTPQPASDAKLDDNAAAVASGPRRRYNKSGKPPRAKGQLQAEVRTYFLDHPRETLTPHEIGKAIGASDGAVVNVCHKLVASGDLSEVTGGKVAFVHTAPQA